MGFVKSLPVLSLLLILLGITTGHADYVGSILGSKEDVKAGLTAKGKKSRIQDILTHAPFSAAAESLRAKAVLDS